MRGKCLARIGLSIAVLPLAVWGASYRLKATPESIVWGYFSASTKPALTVRSGDIVEMQSVWGDPAVLERAGLPPGQVQPELREIVSRVKDRGPGPHPLTGPVAIEGAQPGDVLELRILDVRMDVPYSWNTFFPGGGFLPEDFPESRAKIIPLDRERKVGRLAPGVEIPLAPFFGTMGVAPSPAAGRISSLAPGSHGGNLDNKHLTAGAILYLPVQAPGALFSCGDGHAAQGNGEVDITALETSLTGVFQLILRHDLHLAWPRAETPTHYILMGLDPDLTKAAKMATREAIEFLTNEKHLSRADAYMLTSSAVDLEITQLVDGTVGVHAMIPKSLFKGRP
ncbi:MAG TPA: acetamidase/formamidase family protein [Bryobacteraceae bacterium]|nr:acetamidase/formamidase family protein [Bryobacteraceae bacterium]